MLVSKSNQVNFLDRVSLALAIQPIAKAQFCPNGMDYALAHRLQMAARLALALNATK